MGLLSTVREWLGRSPSEQPDPEQRQKVLNELATPEKGRLERYELYEKRYDGEEGAPLPERVEEYLQRSGLGFTENFIETVVDTFSNYLEVEGWESADDDAASWFGEWWKADEQREVAGIVHTNTPLLGDGVIAVEWDFLTEAPAIRWNHPRHCRFEYDESGRLLVASKVWSESTRSPTNPAGHRIRRLNLYFPDRIEKWFTLANDKGADATWSMHMDEGEEVWPTANVGSDGLPLGISLNHFRHRPLGRSYGRSKIRPVIPQQDLLDKQIIDLCQIGDTQGWPRDWATGVSSAESDAILESNPGDVWTTENKEAKFGSLPAGDMEGALKAIEQTIKRISARSATPISRLMVGASSATGESKKMDVEALVAAVKDAQPGYGTTWGRIASQVCALEASFGSGLPGYSGDPVRPTWRNPEPRDALNDWSVAEAQQRVGVSRTTILSERGYDPTEEADNRREEAAEEARHREVDPEPALPGEIF